MHKTTKYDLYYHVATILTFLSFTFSQRLVHPLLPYGIMGVNALLAGLLCQTLPETKGTPTAETMDTESAGEAYMTLQSTDPKEKDPVEMKDLTMADTIKGTTSSRANLVDDRNSSSI